MRSCIVILFILFVCLQAYSQSPYYRVPICDSTFSAVKTTGTGWDSIYAGGDHFKQVTIIADTTVGRLYVACENDTSMANRIQIVAQATNVPFTFWTTARWIKTKLSSPVAGRFARRIFILPAYPAYR